MLVCRYGHVIVLAKECDVFTVAELKVLGSALLVQEKSVLRLAAKEGQPDTVAAEYRKVAAEIQMLLRKVAAAMDAEVAKVKK